MKLTLMLITATALLSAEGQTPVKSPPPPPPPPVCPVADMMPHACVGHGY